MARTHALLESLRIFKDALHSRDLPGSSRVAAAIPSSPAGSISATHRPTAAKQLLMRQKKYYDTTETISASTIDPRLIQTIALPIHKHMDQP